jgi:hypothetical protein
MSTGDLSGAQYLGGGRTSFRVRAPSGRKAGVLYLEEG